MYAHTKFLRKINRILEIWRNLNTLPTHIVSGVVAIEKHPVAGDLKLTIKKTEITYWSVIFHDIALLKTILCSCLQQWMPSSDRLWPFWFDIDRVFAFCQINFLLFIFTFFILSSQVLWFICRVAYTLDHSVTVIKLLHHRWNQECWKPSMHHQVN